MTDPRTVTESTSTIAHQPAPTPVDQLDDEQFDSSTAPPMTNVKNPEDPEHRDVPDLEANKGIALRFIEGVFIDQDPKAVDELAADDFTAHTFGDLPPGPGPLKGAMQRAGEGVSEPKFEIHDVIAEKDRVAVRLTTRARHTGTFMGVEPSGNEYSIDEIHIFRIEDGKVLEHWHEFDKQRLTQQLRGKDERPEEKGQSARPTIAGRST
jgi:predicted SnoaL-like aldol condensation-catalyzing enzyme